MSGKRLLLSILMVLAFLISCTKEEKASPQVVSLFNITLSSSFNDDGTMSYNSWDKGDRCRFFPASAASTAEISAPPLVAGKIEAEFRVKMSEDLASGAFVVAYPYDAGWSFDGKLNYDIPSEQTGKIETHLAGSVDEGNYKEAREVTFVMKDKGTPFDPLKKADPDITLSAEEREIGGLGNYMVKKRE